jgi:hypothetical protein
MFVTWSNLERKATGSFSSEQQEDLLAVQHKEDNHSLGKF